MKSAPAYPSGDPLPSWPITRDVPPDIGEGIADDPTARVFAGPAGGAVARGLSTEQRIVARNRAVEAALLGLRFAPALHYTQDERRWDGIRHHLSARHGKFPRHADCSSFATWCLWNGLFLSFGLPDTVNGGDWEYGNTDTMHSHGRRVTRAGLVRADLILYGRPGVHRTHHVAIAIGGGLAVSFGSERGPFKVKINYRRDILAYRRYI